MNKENRNFKINEIPKKVNKVVFSSYKEIAIQRNCPDIGHTNLSNEIYQV